MARSRRKKGTRDPSESLPATGRSRLVPGSPMLEVQDFRASPYAPVSSPARLFSGLVAEIGLDIPRKTARKALRAFKLPTQLAFYDPTGTLVCVRRKARKAVLFAKKKTGKAGQRKPRKTRYRSVKC